MCTTIDAHSTTDFLRLLLHRRHLLLHLPTQQFFIHHLERLLTHIICRQWRCFLTLPHPTTFLANLLTSTLIGHLLQLLPTLPQSPTATTTPPPMSSWTTTPMPIPMPNQHAPTRLQLSPQRLFSGFSAPTAPPTTFNMPQFTSNMGPAESHQPPSSCVPPAHPPLSQDGITTMNSRCATVSFVATTQQVYASLVTPAQPTNNATPPPEPPRSSTRAATATSADMSAMPTATPTAAIPGPRVPAPPPAHAHQSRDPTEHRRSRQESSSYHNYRHRDRD